MALAQHKNIAFAVHPEHGLVILLHGRNNPSEAEWKPYIRLLDSALLRGDMTRVLVITDGGHPTGSQQTAMNATLRSRVAHVAVISPSAVARFVTSILVMTHPGIRCFSPQQRHQAYVHLGLSPTVAPQIDTLVAQIRRDLE
jgi:hypothetical protein